MQHYMLMDYPIFPDQTLAGLLFNFFLSKETDYSPFYDTALKISENGAYDMLIIRANGDAVHIAKETKRDIPRWVSCTCYTREESLEMIEFILFNLRYDFYYENTWIFKHRSGMMVMMIKGEESYHFKLYLRKSWHKFLHDLRSLVQQHAAR